MSAQGKLPAAEIERALEYSAEQHVVPAVEGYRLSRLQLAGIAEASAKDMLATGREFDDEDVRPSSASERTAPKVHCSGQHSGQQAVAE